MKRMISKVREVAVAIAMAMFVLAFVACETRELEIMCKTNELEKSADNRILSFAFNGLTPSVTAEVNEVAKTITATVPASTDVTALMPTIEMSPKATVTLTSGASADFTTPQSYTVTAENGTSATYLITVTVTEADEKQILSFVFNGLTPPVTGVIDEEAKTITATVPTGTDVTALIPTIEMSPKATVTPASGAAADFTTPQSYTVTAENGTSATYLVTVINDYTFTDSRGNEVIVPGGELSFANRVVSFIHGNPWTSDPLDMDPNEILGIPDRGNLTNGKAITLGRDGVIVLEFGCYFTDGEGLDIYVFEVGDAVEATKVEVSNDLQNWIYVGDAKGSLSGVDINGKVPAGGKYQYVRLTDLRTWSDVTYTGADVDAVAVIYPIKK
jgi:hypothetical protein